MKVTTTRVLRLLATLLILGAVFATSASPAGATASKATVAASHVSAASHTTGSSAQTLAAASTAAKCTTFWCTHPGCHTFRCWKKYCHTSFCITHHHMHPYGHPFVNAPPPKMMVKSTSFKQGGTVAMAVDDVSSVRLSLVGSNKKTVSLGLFTRNVSTGLLSRAVKLPAGLSGAYTMVATDAVSHQTSKMAFFIKPSVVKSKVTHATKLASANTPSNSVGFDALAVIGLGVLAIGMLGSGSTMLLLGRRRRTWKARA